MPDRFGNPEKVRFKEMGMVNREYTEIIEEPKNKNKSEATNSKNSRQKNHKKSKTGGSSKD